MKLYIYTNRVGHNTTTSGSCDPHALAASVSQVAHHVITCITGWIGILDAQIEGSKLPNDVSMSDLRGSDCHGHASSGAWTGARVRHWGL